MRHYVFELKTEGPVHIGSGNTIGKKDYFVKNNRIAVLDAQRFIASLSDEQIEDYCEFLKTTSHESLEEFLKAHNLHRAAENCCAYEINCRLERNRNGYKYFDVAAFVKDSYGQPYVPGSSLKGMLRTVLLAVLVESSREESRSCYSHEKVLARKGRENADSALEEMHFEKEHPKPSDKTIVNNIMRFVSVSDSNPLDVKQLVFAKKYDKFASTDRAEHKREMGAQDTGEIYEGNDLNIYRECIKPGTTISFKVDIDEQIDQYLPFPLDKKGFVKVFSAFDERYAECFTGHFEENDTKSGGAQPSGDGQCSYIVAVGPLAGTRCRNRAVEGTNFCNMHKDKATEQEASKPLSSAATYCYLGGGVDFDSKTVINSLFADNNERLYELSHILYAQFPSSVDAKFANRKYQPLWNDIKEAGFEPKPMTVSFKYVKGQQKVKKAKDDHRHWMDEELGVSPHTQKLGKVDGKLYPMGKCTLTIKQCS